MEIPDESAATNPDTPQQSAPPPQQPQTPQATDGASVSTPAPNDEPTQNADPGTQTLPTQPTQAMPTPQVDTTQHKDNLAVSVYHSIMGALGGTQDTAYTRDPTTGKMIVSQVAATPGSQWKRIIAGVVQGTAAGLGAGPGPGQLGRALGAGMTASVQGAQKTQQQQQDNANQDYDAQQKALVTKAQTQALTYEGAVHAFQLSRMQVQAHVEDTQRENDFVKLINNGGDGSQDLGVAKDFAGIIQMHKDMPGLLAQNAQGNIIQTAHVNADGQFDGTRFALVTPEWKDQKLDKDQNFYFLQPPTEIGKPATIAKQTVKAGTMSNGDFALRQSASSNEILKWQADQQKAQHQATIDASTVNKNNAEAMQARTEAVKNIAEAGKANKEAAAIPQAGEGMSDSEIVKGMLDGSVDITKTASIRGNARAAYVAAAKSVDPNFNMQDYQVKLGVRKSFADGKDADAIQSFNQFLGHAMDASQSINALRNTSIPLVNTPLNKLKAKAQGNPAVSSFIIQQEAVKNEFQSFLNNNHALLAQDKEAGEKMLSEDMSPAQLQAAMKQFVTTASIRMSAVNSKYRNTIGTDVPNMLDEDGKAALAHFGVPETMVYHHPTGVASPQTKTAAAVTPPAGAQAEVHDATGKLIGHAVNGVYVPLASQ